jgi:transcriptional regulator with XRE-family HTH domain
VANNGNGNGKRLGANLKRLRLAAGMTQKQLAHAAGFAYAIRVAELEHGTVKDPRLSRVVALALALGCSLDELAGMPPRQGKRA